MERTFPCLAALSSVGTALNGLLCILHAAHTLHCERALVANFVVRDVFSVTSHLCDKCGEILPNLQHVITTLNGLLKGTLDQGDNFG